MNPLVTRRVNAAVRFVFDCDGPQSRFWAPCVAGIGRVEAMSRQLRGNPTALAVAAAAHGFEIVVSLSERCQNAGRSTLRRR